MLLSNRFGLPFGRNGNPLVTDRRPISRIPRDFGTFPSLAQRIADVAPSRLKLAVAYSYACVISAQALIVVIDGIAVPDQ